MDIMLRKALWGFLRPLLQLITNLLSLEVGTEWETELKKFLRKEPCWVAEVATTKILEFISTIMVPPTTEEFVAKAKFVDNTASDAPVKIAYLGDNFKMWFLSSIGKVEEPKGDTRLRYAKLTESSVDGPIIAELGGEAKAETTLSEMFSLMEAQKNGKSGVLLNNGYANIFYVRDLSGVLRTVSVYWDGVGWGVDAGEVSDSGAWCGGYQVFSRN